LVAVLALMVEVRFAARHASNSPEKTSVVCNERVGWFLQLGRRGSQEVAAWARAKFYILIHHAAHPQSGITRTDKVPLGLAEHWDPTELAGPPQ